jgi:hypothetical protein
MILTRGEAVLLDAARARPMAERLYMGGGGVGLDAEAARRAGLPQDAGRSRCLLSAIRALVPSVPVRVSGGLNKPCRNGLVLSFNTPSYGGGLWLAPEANLEDGNSIWCCWKISA